MHVLLLGATGRTGKHVLSTLLADLNTTVTALVRNPSALAPQDRLTIVKGTPINATDISNAITSGGHSQEPISAIIITLSIPGPSAPNFLPTAITTTIQAMRQHNIHRLVVLSAFGTGASYQSLSWPLKAVFKYTSMSHVMDEHTAVDGLLRDERAEGIEWTLVKPPMLKDVEARSVREFGEGGKGVGVMDSCSRGSVAEVLVRAVVERRWIREAVVIANR